MTICNCDYWFDRKDEYFRCPTTNNWISYPIWVCYKCGFKINLIQDGKQLIYYKNEGNAFNNIKIIVSPFEWLKGRFINCYPFNKQKVYDRMKDIQSFVWNYRYMNEKHKLNEMGELMDKYKLDDLIFIEIL